MNHKLSLLTAASLCLSFTACDDGSDLRPDNGPMPLVVEAWIEEGEAPVVIVTHAVDLTQDSPSFDDFVEKWGRVSIFDGDKRYLLTGHLNKDYMPSFIFTTSRLKGAVGHTYRLLIETETDTVEAISTMQQAPELLPLEARELEGSPGQYSIIARMADEEPAAFYKFFAKSDSTDTRFYGSFLGSLTGDQYDAENGFEITRGVHSGYSDEEFSHYFASGDRVTIKLCAMEEAVYDFWRIYDPAVSLSQNIFFSFSESCPTNLSGNARGYWAAYGMSRRSIILP